MEGARSRAAGISERCGSAPSWADGALRRDGFTFDIGLAFLLYERRDRCDRLGASQDQPARAAGPGPVVCLLPDATVRLMSHSGVANTDCLSGFPRQITGSLAEQVVIPQDFTTPPGYLAVARRRGNSVPDMREWSGGSAASRGAPAPPIRSGRSCAATPSTMIAAVISRIAIAMLRGTRVARLRASVRPIGTVGDNGARQLSVTRRDSHQGSVGDEMLSGGCPLPKNRLRSTFGFRRLRVALHR